MYGGQGQAVRLWRPLKYNNKILNLQRCSGFVMMRADSFVDDSCLRVFTGAEILQIYLELQTLYT